MRELSKYTSQDLKDELIRRSKELELNNRPKPIDKDKVLCHKFFVVCGGLQTCVISFFSGVENQYFV